MKDDKTLGTEKVEDLLRDILGEDIDDVTKEGTVIIFHTEWEELVSKLDGERFSITGNYCNQIGSLHTLVYNGVEITNFLVIDGARHEDNTDWVSDVLFELESLSIAIILIVLFFGVSQCTRVV